MIDLSTKAIVIVKPDGGVKFKSILDEARRAEIEAYEEADIAKYPGFEQYIEAGCQVVLLDWSAVRAAKAAPKDSRKQIYFDGRELKIDTDWNIRVMPDQVVKQKAMAKLDASIEAAKVEADKTTAIDLMVQKIELEKVKAGPIHSEFWLKESIKGLDANVTLGEPDKPEIREQINSMIQEIENKGAV